MNNFIIFQLYENVDLPWLLNIDDEGHVYFGDDKLICNEHFPSRPKLVIHKQLVYEYAYHIVPNSSGQPNHKYLGIRPQGQQKYLGIRQSYGADAFRTLTSTMCVFGTRNIGIITPDIQFATKSAHTGVYIW